MAPEDREFESEGIPDLCPKCGARPKGDRLAFTNYECGTVCQIGGVLTRCTDCRYRERIHELESQVITLQSQLDGPVHVALREENERLKLRILTAAGDDLCRLTQGEINEMSLGKVKISPKEEFIASCERFHEQMAGELGVLPNCLTLAQMVAENEKLTAENAELRNTIRQWERLTEGFVC